MNSKIIKSPITNDGLIELGKQIDQLKSRRPALSKKIAVESSRGDRSENFEYKVAKEEQITLEGKIAKMENIFKNSYIVDNTDNSKVAFGVSVTLHNNKDNLAVKYKIVGEEQANLKLGLLSINAPIVRAMLNKQKGDKFIFPMPNGNTKDFTILHIEC